MLRGWKWKAKVATYCEIKKSQVFQICEKFYVVYEHSEISSMTSDLLTTFLDVSENERNKSSMKMLLVEDN